LSNGKSGCRHNQIFLPELRESAYLRSFAETGFVADHRPCAYVGFPPIATLMTGRWERVPSLIKPTYVAQIVGLKVEH
jgi:hypothetical protein